MFKKLLLILLVIVQATTFSLSTVKAETTNIPPEEIELRVFLNYEELFDGWWTSILVSWIGEGFPLEWEVSPCNSVITGHILCSSR